MTATVNTMYLMNVEQCQQHSQLLTTLQCMV